MAKKLFTNRSKRNRQIDGLAPEPKDKSRIAAPPFEVQGYHVIIFVLVVMSAAQLAGLLPDP